MKASSLVSFILLLAQYLGDLGCEHVVLKNDEKTVEEIRKMNPRGVLVSPGPGKTLTFAKVWGSGWQ